MTEGPRERFYGIEVLRFFAAAIVVLTHSTFYAFERNDPSTAIWHFGEAGVDIFFVISGFVIVLASRRGSTWVSAGHFLSRRVLRIVPMYWLATSLNLAILIALPSLVLHSELDWAQILNSYLLVPDYNQDGRIEPLLGVAWTLYFETFFYLVFALALLFRGSPFWVTFLVLGAAVVISFFRTPNWPPALVYANPIVIEFLAGMLLATNIHRLKVNKTLSFSLLLLGSVLLVVMGEFYSNLHPVLYRGLPSVMIVAGTISTERYINWKRAGWLIYLGTASYAIYLFHPLVAPAAPVFLTRLGIVNGSLSTLLSVIIAVVGASLIHSAVERPLMERFSTRQR